MQISKHCLTLILATKLLFSVVLSDECSEQGQSCTKDCECCGYLDTNGVVCQTRRHHLGPRCYLFKRHGEPCESNEQCR